MQFLIAYDIFDNKRRRKVAKRVYQYSNSYQKSALVVEIGKRDLKNIVDFLEDVCKKNDRATLFKIKDGFCIGKVQDVEFVI